VRQGSLLELLDAAALGGFGSITVPPPWFAAARAAGHGDSELRRRLDDTGLAVGYIDAVTAGLPGQPAQSTPERYANTLDDCLAAAHGLGAPSINVAHFGGAAIDVGLLSAAIGEMAECARKDGLGLTVEFIPGTGIPDLATAVRIVTDLGAAAVGVLFDTWHHYRSVRSVADGAAVPFGLVHAVQLSDMGAARVASWGAGDPGAMQRNARYVPMTGRLLPGEGVLPSAGVVASLLEVRPEVPLGVEVFSDELKALSVEQAAKRCAVALAGCFPQAQSPHPISTNVPNKQENPLR